jgi:hypothetical protein
MYRRYLLRNSTGKWQNAQGEEFLGETGKEALIGKMRGESHGFIFFSSSYRAG